MINGSNFFDQRIKNDLRSCHNTNKKASVQGDYYTTSFLLGYPYFKKIL